MQNASTSPTRKRLTVTRIISILFLVFAVFFALIGWAISMGETGLRPVLRSSR